MKMKKLLSAALAAALVLSLAACGKKDQPAPSGSQPGSQSTSQSTSQSASSQQADFSDVTIRAAAMNGPTGMGMALLADRAQNSTCPISAASPSPAAPMTCGPDCSPASWTSPPCP